MSIHRRYIKYVSQNILGMMGVSFYVLADTFFISLAQGADGLTALNLILPIYSLIYALAALIGSGFAIRFTIDTARGEKKSEEYFSNALFWVMLLSIPFMVMGGMFPDVVMKLFGADAHIMEVGMLYTRIFMSFTPFFMISMVFQAFVRNDNDPSLAMIATLFSSLFNVVFDYIFMFPMKMGMPGAALATACSPILSILICSAHFFRKQNTLKFLWKRPPIRRMLDAARLGVSGFVGEISGGVTTMVYNFSILAIAGNVGVAAYGIVANTAMVGAATFNGIAQGAQPLISECYGKNDKTGTKKLLRLGLITAIIFAVVLLGLIIVCSDVVVAIFNNENSPVLAELAKTGLILYFIGFLFAGVNMVGCGYLSATSQAKEAFIASILRGFVAITLTTIIMAYLFGMNGVWLAFAVAELITTIVLVTFLKKQK